MKTKLTFVCCCLLAVASCKKEDPVEQTDVVNYSSGTFVLNEGAFLANNASITYRSDASEWLDNIFQTRNDAALGDVATDVAIHKGKMYVVLNNSQNVTVINMSTFIAEAVITGFDYPRQIEIISDELAVVSNGALTGEAIFIDLTTNTVSQSVTVGMGPEDLLVADNMLYVANSGGWGEDSTVSIINLDTFTVDTTVEVGPRPNALAESADGKIWVLCSGRVQYDSDWNVIGHAAATFVPLDGDQVGLSTEFSDETVHPTSMTSAGGDRIYFVANDLMHFDGTADQATFNLAVSGSFNRVSDASGVDEVWVTEAPDYVDANSVFLFDANGVEVDAILSGIAPIVVIEN